MRALPCRDPALKRPRAAQGSSPRARRGPGSAGSNMAARFSTADSAAPTEEGPRPPRPSARPRVPALRARHPSGGTAALRGRTAMRGSPPRGNRFLWKPGPGPAPCFERRVVPRLSARGSRCAPRASAAAQTKRCHGVTKQKKRRNKWLNRLGFKMHFCARGCSMKHCV